MRKWITTYVLMLKNRDVDQSLQVLKAPLQTRLRPASLCGSGLFSYLHFPVVFLRVAAFMHHTQAHVLRNFTDGCTYSVFFVTTPENDAGLNTESISKCIPTINTVQKTESCEAPTTQQKLVESGVWKE